MSLFQKIFQQFLRRFFTDMGREPMTPAEWMEIQDQAVRHLNKTKGAPSIKKDPFQGFDPKIVGKEPIVEEKIGIEELLKGPVRSKGPKGDRIWDFSEKRGEIIDFPKKPKKGIEELIENEEIFVGKAPKTQKSRLDWYKEAANKKRYSDDFYKGPNITKEEWVAKKKQENKDAIRRFQEKMKKDEPDKFYAGGIAPLVGEPSYAAHFYDDRIPYSGGGQAGLPAITQETQTPQMNMQGPQMPAGPQPAGISGANLQMNQMNLMQQQMQQDPWMHNQMKQGIGGTPQYKGQLRMPFGLGGMSRRAFMKMMAGAAALPFMPKAASKLLPTAAPKIAETVATAGSGTGMPSWFPVFVQKILKEGKDLTPTHAPKERVIVAETKLPKSDTPVYVEHDLVTGDTMVDIGMGKHGWSDGYHGQPTRLHLKKGEMIEEGKMKGQKEPDEFVVEEAEFTGGHPENVKFEESSFNNYGEHGSDFSELEEFATGKVTKESKAQKQVWEADWDDSLPDDYASGGIARMLGE
jgi:hypothetical protein